MYALTFDIYRDGATRIYQELFAFYRLPRLSDLLESIDHQIEWNTEKETQVYFMDNLRESQRRDLFQVRFRTSPDARRLTSVFLSVEEEGGIHALSLQFPPRGDQGCSSRIIGWLKSLVKTDGIEAQFELCGFGERGGYRFIREHSLSAFVWNEATGRYLHVTDRPEEIGTRKGGFIR